MNGQEYAQIRREAKRTVGAWNSIADDPNIFQANELEYIQNDQWIDYQKELFRNGSQQNYNIGVSGGSDKTKVYLSLDYLSESGILRLDGTKRYSIRMNIDQNSTYNTCRKYEEHFYTATFNNFAARMDWANEGKGNRNPIAVIDKNEGVEILKKKPRQGTTITLEASKSYDPDGDKLTFKITDNGVPNLTSYRRVIFEPAK